MFEGVLSFHYNVLFAVEYCRFLLLQFAVLVTVVEAALMSVDVGTN